MTKLKTKFRFVAYLSSGVGLALPSTYREMFNLECVGARNSLVLSRLGANTLFNLDFLGNLDTTVAKTRGEASSLETEGGIAQWRR